MYSRGPIISSKTTGNSRPAPGSVARAPQASRSARWPVTNSRTGLTRAVRPPCTSPGTVRPVAVGPSARPTSGRLGSAATACPCSRPSSAAGRRDSTAGRSAKAMIGRQQQSVASRPVERSASSSSVYIGRSPNGSTDKRRRPSDVARAFPARSRCPPPACGCRCPWSRTRRTPARSALETARAECDGSTMSRGGRSTDSPRRASSYRRLPSNLSAECIGGICCCAPRNVASAASTSRRSSGGIGARSTTSVSPSPDSVRAPSCTIDAVGLAGVQQPAADLGRLPEADRQQAGGERIEAAGMTRLGAPNNAASLLQRGVGRQAERLVEQQNAVDVAMEATRLWTRRSGHRSARPASSPSVGLVDVTRDVVLARPCVISADRRAPLSISSSCTKRSSGLWRMPSARPSGPRSMSAAASRISCACSRLAAEHRVVHLRVAQVASTRALRSA